MYLLRVQRIEYQATQSHGLMRVCVYPFWLVPDKSFFSFPSQGGLSGSGGYFGYLVGAMTRFVHDDEPIISLYLRPTVGHWRS